MTETETTPVEPTNAAAAGVIADNFGKFANAAFNGGAAVILGWLVEIGRAHV